MVSSVGETLCDLCKTRWLSFIRSTRDLLLLLSIGDVDKEDCLAISYGLVSTSRCRRGSLNGVCDASLVFKTYGDELRLLFCWGEGLSTVLKTCAVPSSSLLSSVLLVSHCLLPLEALLLLPEDC